MHMGQIIKMLRERNGWTQEQLGEKVGIKKAAINKYESGNVENMKRKMILELSKIFEVSPSYLLGSEDDSEEDFSPSFRYHHFDTPISAGLPNHVDAVTEVNTIELPDSVMGKHAGNKDIFITKVNGDSMDRIIPDKSLIAVKPVDIYQINNGDIIVYSDNGDYSVKRFYKNGEQLIFRPDSNDDVFFDYITSTDNPNLIIHGKVVVYIVELD